MPLLIDRACRFARSVPVILFSAVAADAQDPVPPRKDSTVRLERVTITATRSSQPALLVPLAVTRIDSAQARGTSGVGLDEALRMVPGVLAQSRSGGTDVRLVIRGYGARGAGDRSNAGTSRGVRVLLDGFPETEPDGRTAFDAVDLGVADGIEVVRSNASALWGNASGGLVSISTVPDFGASRVVVEPMTGSFGLKRLVASVGSRFGGGGGDGGEGARAWLDHTNTTQEGWRVHSSGRRQLLNAGVTTPAGRSTAISVHATAVNNLVQVPGPLTWTEYLTDPRQANALYFARRERRHNRTGRLGVSLDHELGEGSGVDVSVFVNPKYLQRSERGTFRDFTRYHFGSSALLHRAHVVGGRRATFTAGVDAAYQSGAILFYNLDPAAPGERGTTLRDNKSEGARNVGVLLQDELPLSDRLVLTLGARYDDINYDSRSFIDPRLNAARSFDGVSPKLGLSLRLGANHAVYANVGGGVEAPAGNETDPATTLGLDTVTAINPLLDPIRSTTFEVGTRRAGTLGSTFVWSYDAAAYTTRVTNEIVPYQGGRFYFTAGRARRSGIEIGASLHSAAGASVRTALTLNRHRYAQYVVDSVHYGRPGDFADYSGNKVVGVPDVIAGAQLSYQPPPLSWLRLDGEIRRSGAYFADDANRVTVPASTVLDAGVSVGRAFGDAATVRARLSVENATDHRYVASAFLNPDRNRAGEYMAFEPGLPRTIVLSLTMSRVR